MDWNLITVPPLRIMNYHPDNWSMWYTQFKLHTIPTSFATLSDREKVAVLLLKLGTEITPIFETFNVDLDNISYDELVRRFNTYFRPVKARNVLLNLKQKSGETFEQFADRLTVHCFPCGFGPFQESFLRDVFLNNIEDKYCNIRSKILESYADPHFREVVHLANRLLLEECALGSGYGALNKMVSPLSREYGPGTHRGSELSENQVFNRTQDYSPPMTKQHRNATRNGTISFSPPVIKPGDTVEVKVLAVHSTVHVSPIHYEGKRQQFIKLLNESLNISSSQVQVEIGKRYVVRCQLEWCRVVVMSKEESTGKARVLSLDYGWREAFNPSEFRMVPLDFVGVGPLALTVTFLEPHSTLTIGQRVWLLFLDVVECLWSVRLAKDGSVDGMSDKIHHLGNRNPDSQKSRNPYRSTNQENKGIKNGLSKNNEHQQSADNRRKRECGEDQEISTDKSTGNERVCNKVEQNSGGRNQVRRDRPRGSLDQEFRDTDEISRTDQEQRGNRSHGMDQRRQTQNPMSKNESVVDGPKMKNSQEHSTGNRGTRNSHASDQNESNRNPSKIGGQGGNICQTDADHKGNQGNRQINRANDNKRDQHVGSRNNVQRKTTSREDIKGRGNSSQNGDIDTSNHSSRGNTEVDNVPIPELCKLQLDEPPIDTEQFTKVVVVHPINDQVAYVYPERSRKEFDELFDHIQTMCSETTERRVLKTPAKGMYCAAPFEGDFYRAMIQDVRGSSAKVLFYDFGNVEDVPCKHLLTLPRELSRAASLSFPIKVPDSYNFSDVTPMDEIEVKAKCKVEGGFWLVDVGKWSSSSSSPAALPVTASSPASCSPKAQQADELGKELQSNSSSQSIKTQAPEGGRSASGSSRSSHASLAQPVDDAPVRSPKPPIPKNTFSAVRVVYTGKEGTFVIPGHELEAMAELCVEVEAVTKNASPCSTPVIKKVYAAPFDGGMFRAKVLSIDRPNECCSVEFIDFGNQCIVSFSDLLELPPELTKRVFIFKIRLDPICGVVMSEAMDIRISPVTMDSDGSWLVQLEGEPINADYQLPEPNETDDDFIGFKQKS